MNDIDTDQIIPARFLTGTVREGLGKHVFADLRFADDGQPREEFPLNRPWAAGARILLAGNNFGCGSSREHAAWALTEYGIRAVISTSFADIFSINAVKNGLLPVSVDPEAHARLQEVLRDRPYTEVTVDLDAQELRWDGSLARFPVDSFSRQCLLHGVDELGYILRFREEITAYETRLSVRGDR
jgi:3-isopropylmalate/(R)-2-methylmalate dehydratase small subunit